MGEAEEPSPLPSFILIDGGDSFDPSSLSEAACSRLLWVCCMSMTVRLKAGNLLVRDGNVPFDFQLTGTADWKLHACRQLKLSRMQRK